MRKALTYLLLALALCLAFVAASTMDVLFRCRDAQPYCEVQGPTADECAVMDWPGWCWCKGLPDALPQLSCFALAGDGRACVAVGTYGPLAIVFLSVFLLAGCLYKQKKKVQIHQQKLLRIVFLLWLALILGRGCCAAEDYIFAVRFLGQ